MWALMCFVTAAGFSIVATADSEFDIVGESKCADACDPKFGVDPHVEIIFGAPRDLDCDDKGFNIALRAVGVDRSSVIAATRQVVAGFVYVAHVKVEDLYCRVPIYVNLDDRPELLEDRFCCDDEPAASLMRC